MEDEPNLIRRAIDAVQQSLRADVSLRATIEGPNELRIGEACGPITLECKADLRPGTAAVLAERLHRRAGPTPAVVVTEYASPAVEDALRAMNIMYMDAAGNAWLDIPGATVVISGRTRAGPRPVRGGGVGRAAWRVGFVLLTDSKAASLSVRALGARAGVSHGAAAEALEVFEKRGWITHLGASGHPVRAREAFVDAWVQGFADRLAPSLELARVRPSTALTAWKPNQGPLLGGELAAFHGGLGVRPATGSVYVLKWDGAEVGVLRAPPDPEGPIVVRQRFTEDMADPTDPRLTHPLIVLAELSMIPDPRLDEARGELRRRLLAAP